MSSSTTLTFIFPEMTTLEVSIGNGVVPAYLGLAENRDITFGDVKALRLMGDSNIVGAMSRFDQSMLNMLIARHETHEHIRCRDAVENGTEYFPSTCLYLKVAHHR